MVAWHTVGITGEIEHLDRCNNQSSIDSATVVLPRTSPSPIPRLVVMTIEVFR